MMFNASFSEFLKDFYVMKNESDDTINRLMEMRDCLPFC